MAQWWYNTSFQTSLNITPFEALYEYAPPKFGINSAAQGVHPDIDDYIEQRQSMKQLLKGALEEAQHRIKSQADKKRTERSFAVGDWVYLRLQPYRQTSVQLRRNLKLSAKFFGPYQIEAKVGQVAYKLKLPADSKIYPTFHVSQLKPKLGKGTLPQTTISQLSKGGEIKVRPLQVLESRVIKKNICSVKKVLIQWEGMENSESTWEDKQAIKVQFPKVILEDKNLKEGDPLP
ncbi:uncharacterized protein LOC113305876 [Papaver somniferum]|uniref:uncharacterized protein LOC113305876 n=1 Tax=Papaver somniferum TaxID=3469 RepID=UPI000E703238|nr:uncharacterized protein LOC113305876 [Papaver somniferum]